MEVFFDKANLAKFDYPQLLLEADGSQLYVLAQQQRLKIDEMSALLIALAPHLQTNFFDPVIQ